MSNPDRNATKGVYRALVTGGAGFVGSHLVAELVRRGASTLVIDDLSGGSGEHLPPGALLEVADIVSADLTGTLATWRPDVVFHLAAQTSVPVSMTDPQRDLEVNVVGTRRILQAARTAGCRSFVFVSSGGAVYGETSGPATERTLPRPASYYGSHKLLAEHYVRNSGLSAAIARPSNIYGPHQTRGSDGAVVPSFVFDAMEGRPLPIHGTGLQVRDFIYVADMVNALLLLAERGAGKAWNVSSGRGTTILELAEAVSSAVGRPLTLTHGPVRRGDVYRSLLSPARLARLGWAPVIDLQEGIRRTVEVSLGNAG